MIRIKRLVRTCPACPAQWDAWDGEGNYYYLRYRWGTLSVSRDSADVYSVEWGATYHGEMDFRELKSALSGWMAFDCEETGRN